MSKMTNKKKFHLQLGSLFLFGSAAVALFIFEFHDVPISPLSINWKSDNQRKLFLVCKSIHSELSESSISHDFSEIKLNMIPPIEDKQTIESEFKKCFPKNTRSKFSLDADIFSSDYEGKDGDLLITQISIFDSKFNKIIEIDRHIEIDPKK